MTRITQMTASEFTISECTRNNLCVDCDEKRCWRHGQKEEDCPKYHCDDPTGDCEKCPFIDEYIKEMREFYEQQVMQGL